LNQSGIRLKPHNPKRPTELKTTGGNDFEIRWKTERGQTVAIQKTLAKNLERTKSRPRPVVAVKVHREMIGSKTAIALKKLFPSRTASQTRLPLERKERNVALFKAVRSKNLNRSRNANK
jgi:hypothetical protein